MHTLKVIFLLVVLLTAMRLGSWMIGWLFARICGHTKFFILSAANGVSFVLFLGVLALNLMPGESFDCLPAFFAAAVYSVYLLCDRFWYPWRRHPPQGDAGNEDA